jgi:hypothetical protein
MSSTRRTRARFGAWYRKPAAAAAEAAEGAEGAEVAEPAEVADAGLAAQVATTATEAAVCRGELAAFARSDCFPITLTTQVVMAGFDKVDPANPCIICSATRMRGQVRASRPGGFSNLIGKCQRASWTREFQWSINMPCAGEPESQARCAC